MSLPLASSFHVPERTAEIAHAALPKGNRYMQMRDTLGTVYTNAHFADLVWLKISAVSTSIELG
jgi:transposase